MPGDGRNHASRAAVNARADTRWGAGKGQGMPDITADAGKQSPSAEGSAEKLFTQEEVNRIVEGRVARVKAEPPADYDELKAKAARLDELEEAAKSDLDKANERAAAAEAKVAEYEAAESRRAWTAKAAEATGVPVDVLSAIEADSEESLMEKAESLKGYFTAPPAPVVGSDGVRASVPAPESGDDWLRSTLPGRRR